MISICYIPHSLHVLFLSSFTCLYSLVYHLASFKSLFSVFFFFFSLVRDLHLLGVSYWSSIALFWWCRISFIFLMGLCWCLCLWGEVISSGLFRLASVGKAFPPEVAMRALAGWDAVSLVPEEAQWFRLHATALADLGRNRGSFMPTATEDRQQMGLLVSSESEVALCLWERSSWGDRSWCLVWCADSQS